MNVDLARSQYIGIKMLFSEITEFARLGQKKFLGSQDFPELPAELHPKRFAMASPINSKSRIDFLLKAIRPARRRFYFGLTMMAGSCLFGLVGPFLLREFVDSLSGSSTLISVIWGATLGLGALGNSLLFQYYLYQILSAIQITGNHLYLQIYNKSLRLSTRARSQKLLGDMINHLGSDSDLVADTPMLAGDMLAALMYLIGAIASLFWLVGVSAVVVVLVALVLLPFTHYLAKKIARVDEKLMEERDRRVNLLTQVLNAIRVVKYFGWERSAESQIQQARSMEQKHRAAAIRFQLISTAVYISLSTVILFLVLWVKYRFSNELSLSEIFACIATTALLETPFHVFSEAISRWMQAWVSIGRIREFLSLE